MFASASKLSDSGGEAGVREQSSVKQAVVNQECQPLALAFSGHEFISAEVIPKHTSFSCGETQMSY